MADDHLLRELLESPLDDEAPRRSGAGASAAVVVALAALTATVLALRDGGAAPASTIDISSTGNQPGADNVEEPTPPAVEPQPPEVAAFPEESVFHEMAAVGDGVVVVFGGLIPDDSSTRPFDGTWTLDMMSGEWSVSQPDPAPSPRIGHAFAYHPPTGRVVLFGGGTTQPRRCPRTRFCAGPEDAQLWQYEPETGVWLNMTPSDAEDVAWPSPRFGAAFAYEPVTERLLMFGGVGVFGDAFTPTFYDETWAYDPTTNEWEDLSVADEGSLRPPGRSAFGMAWNDDAERVMLFGGDGLSGDDDDRLWAFDPVSTVWEDLGVSESGPRERWFHVVTSDPRSGRLVVIGGTGSVFTAIQGGFIRSVEYLDEVWTWSPGEGWVAQNRTVAPLTPVSGVADPATLGIIVYDGHDVLSYDVSVDAWETIADRPEVENG